MCYNNYRSQNCFQRDDNLACYVRLMRREDVAQVSLDRALADDQLLGNSPIRSAGGNKA